MCNFLMMMIVIFAIIRLFYFEIRPSLNPHMKQSFAEGNDTFLRNIWFWFLVTHGDELNVNSE